ncbi:NACHT domain-containing protein [Streptomyces olivaceoviridis]
MADGSHGSGSYFDLRGQFVGGDQFNADTINYNAAPPVPPAPPFGRAVRITLRVVVVTVACGGAGWAALRWSGWLTGPGPAWIGVIGVLALGLLFYEPLRGANDFELAERLVLQVLKEEVWQQQRLTGNKSERINLVYKYVATPHKEPENARKLAMTTGRLLDTPKEGQVGIAAYYRALMPGRLIITGEAGSGKTTAALEVLIGLLETRSSHAAPIPVRIPISHWDPDNTSLSEVLTNHLVRVYNWPPRRAARFVGDGRILPILDGLDEMDPPGPDGKPDPASPHARRALKKLNELRKSTKAGPVIVTCRSDLYRDISRTGSRLEYAAHVAITDVPVEDARSYLTLQGGREQWEWIFSQLDTRRGSSAGAQLLQMLSTPWRLALVATVCTAGVDPRVLTRFRTAKELDHFLLSEYVPAAITLYEQRGYRESNVHRWLYHLARHATSAGGRQVGLFRLHELWTVAGRKALGVSYALVALVMFAAFIRFIPGLTSTDQKTVTALALLPAIGGTYYVFAPPRRLESPWRLLKRNLWFRNFLIVTILCTPWTAIPRLGLAVGILAQINLLFFVWLCTWFLSQPREDTTRSRDILRDDLKVGFYFAVLFAGSIVLMGARDGTLVHDIPLAVANGIYCLILYGGAYLRHRLFAVCALGKLPVRLERFLDWAVSAGVLRRAGSAYQFRHRELQDWQASHPDPPERPSKEDGDRGAGFQSAPPL